MIPSHASLPIDEVTRLVKGPQTDSKSEAAPRDTTTRGRASFDWDGYWLSLPATQWPQGGWDFP